MRDEGRGHGSDEGDGGIIELQLRWRRRTGKERTIAHQSHVQTLLSFSPTYAAHRHIFFYPLLIIVCLKVEGIHTCSKRDIRPPGTFVCTFVRSTRQLLYAALCSGEAKSINEEVHSLVKEKHRWAERNERNGFFYAHVIFIVFLFFFFSSEKNSNYIHI